jgi:hypothetical protein
VTETSLCPVEPKETFFSVPEMACSNSRQKGRLAQEVIAFVKKTQIAGGPRYPLINVGSFRCHQRRGTITLLSQHLADC